jgi:hypothetical protein
LLVGQRENYGRRFLEMFQWCGVEEIILEWFLVNVSSREIDFLLELL